MAMWFANKIFGPKNTNGTRVKGWQIFDVEGNYRGFAAEEGTTLTGALTKVDPFGSIRLLGTYFVRREDITRAKLYPFPARPGATPLHRGDTRITGIVHGVRRLPLSSNGNPRFVVSFYDGEEVTEYTSMSDVADSHGGFENGWRDKTSRRATLTLSEAGRIRFIDYHE